MSVLFSSAHCELYPNAASRGGIPGGSSSFAALSLQEDAAVGQDVAPLAPILYNTQTVLQGITYNALNGELTFSTTGFYRVSYYIILLSSSEWALYLNGAIVPESLVKTDGGDRNVHPLFDVILQITAGSTLSVNNNDPINNSVVQPQGTGVSMCSYLVVTQIQ